MIQKLKHLQKDTAFKLTIFLFIGAFLTTYGFFYNEQDVTSTSLASRSVGTVLGRSYPLSQPDLNKNEGGVITVEGITAVVSENTFGGDIYFRVDRTMRGTPIHVEGLWQVTNIWETRLRFMANDNDISTIDTKKNYILSFPYTTDYLTTDQGVTFSESSLKLIRGESVTGPWTILDGAVQDTTNDTFSVVTNRGGHFMISGGFRSSAPKTTTSTTTTTTAKKPTTKPTAEPTVIILQKFEIVVTVTPTPEPNNIEEVEDVTKPLYQRLIDFFYSSLGF